MPVMVRDVNESVSDLATKIAVEIQHATVSEKSSGVSWSVGRMRRPIPGKFALGETVLYRPDPNEKIKGWSDPKNIQIIQVPRISIKPEIDFEKLNQLLLKSAILVEYKKYISMK